MWLHQSCTNSKQFIKGNIYKFGWEQIHKYSWAPQAPAKPKQSDPGPVPAIFIIYYLSYLGGCCCCDCCCFWVMLLSSATDEGSFSNFNSIFERKFSEFWAIFKKNLDKCATRARSCSPAGDLLRECDDDTIRWLGLLVVYVSACIHNWKLIS